MKDNNLDWANLVIKEKRTRLRANRHIIWRLTTGSHRRKQQGNRNPWRKNYRLVWKRHTDLTLKATPPNLNICRKTGGNEKVCKAVQDVPDKHLSKAVYRKRFERNGYQEARRSHGKDH
jgi:hypothetical protein